MTDQSLPSGSRNERGADGSEATPLESENQSQIAHAAPLECPKNLVCAAIAGIDPKTGAQMLSLQFALPMPSGIIGTVGGRPKLDPYLEQLLHRLNDLGSAIAKGDVLEIRRSEPTGETAAAHIANARQVLAGVLTYGREELDRDRLTKKGREFLNALEGIAARLETAAELLDPAKAPPKPMGQAFVFGPPPGGGKTTDGMVIGPDGQRRPLGAK